MCVIIPNKENICLGKCIRKSDLWLTALKEIAFVNYTLCKWCQMVAKQDIAINTIMRNFFIGFAISQSSLRIL